MLTPKEQQRLKKYEEDLAMPRWKYILGFGMTFSILLFGITLLTDSFIFHEQWDKGLITRIILMVPAGILYGWFMRKTVEKQVIRLKKR